MKHILIKFLQREIPNWYHDFYETNSELKILMIQEITINNVENIIDYLSQKTNKRNLRKKWELFYAENNIKIIKAFFRFIKENNEYVHFKKVFLQNETVIPAILYIIARKEFPMTAVSKKMVKKQITWNNIEKKL